MDAYIVQQPPWGHQGSCLTHILASSPAPNRSPLGAAAPAPPPDATPSNPLSAARAARAHRAQLRHPNVLSFKDTLEVQEKAGTTIYLVTEPVRPLAMVLKELDLSGQHRWAAAAAASAGR